MCFRTHLDSETSMMMNMEFTMEASDFTTEKDIEYPANQQGRLEMNTQRLVELNDTPQKSESTSSPSYCGDAATI